jgi:3-hydroxyacyl-CoA dehydrogenase
MVELREDALVRARNTIGKTLARDVDKGRISADEADTRLRASPEPQPMRLSVRSIW